MIYDIRLAISHTYAVPAGNGRHVLRVLPRVLRNRQRVTAHLVEALPVPDERLDGIDFFGNSQSTITQRDPHKTMTIRMSSRVEVTAPPAFDGLRIGVPALQQVLYAHQSVAPSSPLHFLGPSPRLSADRNIAEFAQKVVSPGTSVRDHVEAVGRALYERITFDAAATTVDTDASEAFAQRRGVCQDLSHIMILALQSLGIPAGYVSGYLRTLPPPGGVKLEGVDAMHAWVSAWCGPAEGWVEYDPTNATFIGTDHIVVGFGRDYSDVSPVIGRLRSSGEQVHSQSVDVAVLD